MAVFSKEEWFSNISNDLLAGIVVALALIPEAIAFSIIAGLDPKVGLYASFSICVVIAFTGARPGMVSAATGAMALLMTSLVKNHGLDYLLAATLLTGVIQYVIGWLKLGNLMRFIAKSIITGFINALAILIFMAQLPELTDVTWHVYALTLAGLGIIYLLPLIPKIGKALPSPLVCIVAITLISTYLGFDVRTVGDMGELPNTLPVFLLPDIPFNLETLQIIFPYSLALAVVGVLESLMTATIIDDYTDSTSDKNKECKGQGVANIVAGLLGGMAGCAMIGQSMVNMKSGGRTRLSTLFAGVALLVMVVFLGDFLKQIPMAALVAVMIMVSISTFSWKSLVEIKHHPLQSNVIMLATVVSVVMTHNLAIGVLVGVLLASVFYANASISIMDVVDEVIVDGEHITHKVHGQIFFASAYDFVDMFSYDNEHPVVTIDLSDAHFWDITAVDALDRVVLRFSKLGNQVEVIGMNPQTEALVKKYGKYDNPNFLTMTFGH
ncbi:C4-dicarboxylic acid transporter DauA [Vibrio mediterranei]|uniref:SulP family inorganic anion transporter n=1 Tax=Vibrio mediterranei TaxID=689 RepID=A0ABX5DL98_9VIBR|nr:SulP family inorganic anion transporter [Vibrio mediterranei]MCG9658945.1 SulP family inorganic anion transporter [Vibrio mediterranei]MCG9664912.1 SulP family inorganic anion transporter [Vibrio mediterranei]PCD89766.1 SulP family inorganic anion transporter [Vibrio mediterranei]PRQ69155.1 SulP family inorganic anion transporter [Vibrio mediterranei]SBO11392.1 C4-dicarboxylic acid transporter DauA [Vibrio mediterranei]